MRQYRIIKIQKVLRKHNKEERMDFVKRFLDIFFGGTERLIRRDNTLMIDGNANHAPDCETSLCAGDCATGVLLSGLLGAISVFVITIFICVFTNTTIMFVCELKLATFVVWLIATLLWLLFFCWKRWEVSWQYAKKGWSN